MLDCLLENATDGVLDYGQVMSCLQSYKAPHRKITELLRKGDLLRVKKGLYLVGEAYNKAPVSRELIANLLFGPSYVSQEFALAFYGMIPERVAVVTSMTCKRRKKFETPLGLFQYDYLNLQRFSVGVDWVPIRESIFILVASPEKALVDTIAKYRDITTRQEMTELLIDNLRLDQKVLKSLDLKRLQKISNAYKHCSVSLLTRVLMEGCYE